MEPGSILYSIATSVALVLGTSAFSPDMKILELSGPVKSMAGYVDSVLFLFPVDTIYFDAKGECLAFNYMKRDEIGRLECDSKYAPQVFYEYVNNDEIVVRNNFIGREIKYYYDGAAKLVRTIDVSPNNARYYGCDTLCYSYRYERMDVYGNWLQRTCTNETTGATELQIRKITYFDVQAPQNNKAMFDVVGPVKSIDKIIIADHIFSKLPVTFTAEGEVSRVANYIWGHDIDNNLAYLQAYDASINWVDIIEVTYDDNRNLLRLNYSGAPDQSASMAYNVALFYDAEGRLSKVEGIEMEEYTALYYVTTFEYLQNDRYNNWTSRRLTTQYLYSEEFDGELTPINEPARTEVQNRVIEYYH